MLTNISEESMTKLGFRFAAVDLLWRNLLVPPVSSRPARGSQTRLSAENDFTMSLREILKYNQQLDDSQDSYMVLARAIAAFSNNKFQTATFAVKRESVRERISGLKSKRGRLRATIFGKRNNFTARSVIVCDNSMGLDEVGVPLAICQDLYFSETVVKSNVHHLLSLVRSSKYPRARYYSKEGSDDKIAIHKDNPDRFMIDLKYGDVVHRDLVNGDYVLFNRQPTLHKQSIMAHKIRVIHDDAFHINISLTVAFAADFDGDEMNLSLVLTEQGRAEAASIMSVANNILKNGQPIIKFVQHALLAMFMLTQPDTTLSPEQAMQYLYQGNVVQVFDQQVSGREMFSCLLPNDLTVLPYVRDGQLLQTVDKSTNAILLAIHNLCGAEYTLKWIHRTQKVLTAFLDDRGLSVSFEDYRYDIDPEVERTYQRGLDYVTDNASRPEEHLCEVLAKCRDITGDHVLTKMRQRTDHPLILLTDSGAKGSEMNLIQSSAQLGQSFDNLSLRAKPTVHSGSNSSFIASSFVGGLDTVEYFHHLVGARAGLVDTAVKTSETGYAARKLGKFLEDCVLGDNGVVTDSGRIVQLTHTASTGRHVGMLCAQNLSEPLTQMTLNSFHASGQANALVSGVARVFEIINCSASKTPSMTLQADVGVDVDQLAADLVGVVVGDTVEYCVADGDHLTVHLCDGIDPHRWCDDLKVVLQPLEMDVEIVYGKPAIVGWDDGVEALAMHVLYRDKIAPTLLRGVANITSASVVDGVITTIGSSLSEVMLFDGVDKWSVSTSDILETLNVFGIDVTCQRIQDELSSVMRASHVHVEPAHVQLLANVICRDGYLRPVTYRGIARSDQCLKNASFEKCLESFITGAVRSATDNSQMSVNSIALLKPLYGSMKALAVPPPSDREMVSRSVSGTPSLHNIHKFTKSIRRRVKRKISVCNEIKTKKVKPVSSSKYRFTANHNIFVF